MKFVFYYNNNLPWEEKIAELREEFQGVEFITPDRMTDRDIETAHALVGMIPIEHIRRASQLKMIFVSFTGPNMFPLEELRKRGIGLSNTHGNARFVAERGLALAMAFYGKVMEYHEDLKQDRWHGLWGKGGLGDTWNSIQGMRCAVIGTGEIGKWIAKFLKIFDCHVTGFKKRPSPGQIENFDKVTLDLEEALKESEIVFITLPLTDESRGMFDAGILSRMRDKFIVNVGRGDVIDEEALYKALKDGTLKGAALDVWFNYPERGTAKAEPSRYPFRDLPNVIMSPHVGGFVPKAAMLNLEQTIENIRSYLRTGRPVFEIDLNLMY